MASQEISQASCLNPGADLWVVPERKNSLLTQKMDWYLNFQITKSARHETRPLSPKISEILKKCALESYDWAETKTDGLLILSSFAFPNRWVMVVRGSDQFSAWVQTIHEKWQKMNRPSLRVFLPKGAARNDFEKAWKSSADQVGLVLET